MRKLIRLLVALLLVFESVADAFGAPIGNPFMRGLTNPRDLADMVENSLSADPAGQMMLDPIRCKKDGSCARPIDYLSMFVMDDPEALVEGERLMRLNQLPTYLRSLVIRDAPKGRYWMACLKRSFPMQQETWTALHDCLARTAAPGEKFWFNPQTNRPVLAEDCTNPIGQQELPNECVYIYFYTKPGDTAVRLAEAGPRPLADRQCAPALKRAGEANFESAYVEECYEALCDMRDIQNALTQIAPSLILQRKGSFHPQPGLHVLRLPKYVALPNSPYRFIFCVDRWEGPAPMVPTYTGRYVVDYEQYRQYTALYYRWIATHSCGLGVQWFDYLGTSTKVATIYYDEAAAVNANAHTTLPNVPSVLWWHWQDTGCR